jgi:putative transposase
MRLTQIMREVCQEHQAEVLSLEVMPDHVHVLVEVDPQFGIHRLVRLITALAPRVSSAETEAPNALDKQLLRFDGGRSAFKRH